MSYIYYTHRDSPNFTPNRRARAVFGRTRSIERIVIHHWGADNQNFWAVVNWLCRPGGDTSAHYVLQDNEVACIVNLPDVAWHAGNGYANVTGVGIECRPEATEGDYDTVGDLVADLWVAYGWKIPLTGHNDWYRTVCPGRYDHDRIWRIANDKYPAALREHGKA